MISALFILAYAAAWLGLAVVVGWLGFNVYRFIAAALK